MLITFAFQIMATHKNVLNFDFPLFMFQCILLSVCASLLLYSQNLYTYLLLGYSFSSTMTRVESMTTQDLQHSFKIWKKNLNIANSTPIIYLFTY